VDEPVFSNHVRSLLDGTFDNNPAILSHLKRELQRQLKKIGQWNLSPSYLAFDGESWERSDALDELTQEVYIYCIQKRLSKLGEHLSVTGSCEGSVRKKISWYLQDRQEKGNPIARRVYRNVRAASESLIEKGTAKSSEIGKLTGKTNILAPGRLVPASKEEIAEHLAGQLGDREFSKLISRDCPASWRQVETEIERCFARGMPGYQIGELAKLLSDACKRPDRVADSESDTNEGLGNVWNSISESRTDVRQGRYEIVNTVDERDEFDALIGDLKEEAKSGFAVERIKLRLLRLIDTIVELKRKGEDVRQLSYRKLEKLLGVPKSTLAEDFVRLETLRRQRDTKSGDKKP